MTMFRSDIAKTEMAYLDNKGDGTPIILIHGLGGSGLLNFAEVMEHPALARRHVLTIDLPGFGQSGRPADYPYDTTTQAKVLKEFLDAFYPETDIVVFGHSMGGAIAVELAELLGDHCARLIVAEGNMLAGGGFASKKIAALPVEDYDAKTHLADCDALEAAGHVDGAESWRRADPRAVHRASQSLVKGVEPIWIDRVAAMPASCIMIFGEHNKDHFFIPTIRDMGLELLLLAGSGHNMTDDNPAGLAELIAQAIDMDVAIKETAQP